MEKKTKGAWLLAQSKNLDGFSGAGAARLENISYSGKVGRLYNLLRRQSDEATTFTISKQIVDNACQLNGIDKSARQVGLQILKDAGRIDVASDGSIAVLGATTQAVLEATVEIFDDQNPSADEQAILDLSEQVSGKPMKRAEAEEYISDTHKIEKADATTLVDLSKQTALIDEEGERGHGLLFNSHTFRDGKYAEKAHTRHRLLYSGVTYGDSGDSRVQASIDTVLAVISKGVKNGRSIARQTGDALEEMFAGVRAEIVAEFFAKEQNGAHLFPVARELEFRAHSRIRSEITALSIEAKSIIGVFADFVGAKRAALMSGEFVTPAFSTAATITAIPPVATADTESGASVSDVGDPASDPKLL